MLNRSNQFHQNQFLSRRIFFPTFLGKNLLESSNPRASFPVTVRFGVQWRITRDEIEATAKLGNYPNIPLDVNDAAELAAFAILPLPCVTVLQSRGHKLHETCPLLSAVSRNNFPRRFLRNYIANLPEDFNGESVHDIIFIESYTRNFRFDRSLVKGFDDSLVGIIV